MENKNKSRPACGIPPRKKDGPEKVPEPMKLPGDETEIGAEQPPIELPTEEKEEQ